MYHRRRTCGSCGPAASASIGSARGRGSALWRSLCWWRHSSSWECWGLWPIDTLDEARKQVVRHEVASQVQYYADKLAALGVEHGPIRFGSGTSQCEMRDRKST